MSASETTTIGKSLFDRFGNALVTLRTAMGVRGATTTAPVAQNSNMPKLNVQKPMLKSNGNNKLVSTTTVSTESTVGGGRRRRAKKATRKAARKSRKGSRQSRRRN